MLSSIFVILIILIITINTVLFHVCVLCVFRVLQVRAMAREAVLDPRYFIDHIAQCEVCVFAYLPLFGSVHSIKSSVYVVIEHSDHHHHAHGAMPHAQAAWQSSRSPPRAE